MFVGGETGRCMKNKAARFSWYTITGQGILNQTAMWRWTGGRRGAAVRHGAAARYVMAAASSVNSITCPREGVRRA